MWFNATLNSGTVPDNAIGADTDYFLDDSSGTIYQKISGSWEVIYAPAQGSGGFGVIQQWVAGTRGPSSIINHTPDSNGPYYDSDNYDAGTVVVNSTNGRYYLLEKDWTWSYIGQILPGSPVSESLYYIDNYGPRWSPTDRTGLGTGKLVFERPTGKFRISDFGGEGTVNSTEYFFTSFDALYYPNNSDPWSRTLDLMNFQYAEGGDAKCNFEPGHGGDLSYVFSVNVPAQSVQLLELSLECGGLVPTNLYRNLNGNNYNGIPYTSKYRLYDSYSDCMDDYKALTGGQQNYLIGSLVNNNPPASNLSVVEIDPSRTEWNTGNLRFKKGTLDTNLTGFSSIGWGKIYVIAINTDTNPLALSLTLLYRMTWRSNYEHPSDGGYPSGIFALTNGLIGSQYNYDYSRIGYFFDGPNLQLKVLSKGRCSYAWDYRSGHYSLGFSSSYAQTTDVTSNDAGMMVVTCQISNGVIIDSYKCLLVLYHSVLPVEDIVYNSFTDFTITSLSEPSIRYLSTNELGLSKYFRFSATAGDVISIVIPDANIPDWDNAVQDGRIKNWRIKLYREEWANPSSGIDTGFYTGNQFTIINTGNYVIEVVAYLTVSDTPTGDELSAAIYKIYQNQIQSTLNLTIVSWVTTTPAPTTATVTTPAPTTTALTTPNTTPQIYGFSPTSAPSGTTVTIYGANFTGATEVTFNSYAASSFTVISSGQINAVAPAVFMSSSGLGPIRITTPAGVGTSSSNFSGLP
jgi:hypothetical protein